MPRRLRYRCIVALAAGLCLGLPAGCAARREKKPPEVSAPAASSRSTVEQPPTFTRNYMVYSVHHGRAADLAATLEPVLQARYGPEARVVPHIPSNKLFIYLPPDNPDKAKQR